MGIPLKEHAILYYCRNVIQGIRHSVTSVMGMKNYEL